MATSNHLRKSQNYFSGATEFANGHVGWLGPRSAKRRRRMMRLETKIFYGAFLALLAFYAVIKLPGEIKRITASRREVELRSTLHSLTPVLLTKRCGPPTKDAAFVSYGDYLWRDLEYKSGLVTFRFSNATGDTKKKPDENDPKKWSVSVVGFDGKSDDNLAREMMPCALKLK